MSDHSIMIIWVVMIFFFLPEQLCPPRPPGGGRLPVPLTGQPLALGQPCGGQRFSSWSFSHETQVGVYDGELREPLVWRQGS